MERFNWQDVISLNIYLLRILGLWPRNHSFNLYTLYTTVVVILFFIPNVLCQTMNLIFASSILEALTQIIIICIAQYLAVVKIFTFVLNIRILKDLMTTLESDIFQPESPRQIALLQPAIKIWKMICRTVLGGAGPGVFLWVTFPIWNGSVKEYVLPFPAWYPYNTKLALPYELTYLHQTISTVFLALGEYNIDLLISALMMYVGAQCDILCDNLKRLGADSRDFQKRLMQCIIHHKKILRFSQDCNDFFDFIVLVQFFTSSTVMAILLFRLVLVNPSDLEFYTFVTSMMVMAMQIFNYCWFGDEVETKSSKIAYAAFESAWIQEDLAAKKSLIIFTERVQTPIKLSTFKLFYLSLDTFVKVFRSAVSYYTVLRQLGGFK